MYQCPNCGNATISLFRIAVSRMVTCKVCGTVVQPRPGLRNVVVAVPFVAPAVFARYNDTGVVNELVVLGIAAALAFAALSWSIKLEVLK